MLNLPVSVAIISAAQNARKDKMVMTEPESTSTTQQAEITRAANCAAAQLHACGTDVKNSVEIIRNSFQIPGTVGAAHKDLLQTKIKGLFNLANLCTYSAQRLLDECSRSFRQAHSNQNFNDILMVCQSLLDQLNSEQADACLVLDTIRPVGALKLGMGTRK